MTKLTQWLFCGVLFMSSWLALIMEHTPIKMTDDVKIWAYLIPVFAIAIFGVINFFIRTKKIICFNFIFFQKGYFFDNHCLQSSYI